LICSRHEIPPGLSRLTNSLIPPFLFSCFGMFLCVSFYSRCLVLRGTLSGCVHQQP
jgi:hypothetical protein